MGKLIGMMLLVSLVLACGETQSPKQQARDAAPYVVISSMVNPANRSLTVLIRIDPPINEARVKTAVESVVEKNRSQFQNITVKSFASPNGDGMAFAVSEFDGQSISHQFNPQAAPQKIPSH